MTAIAGVAMATSSLAVADFDGDGWPDIALEGPGGPAIVFGTGGGAFTAPLALYAPGPGLVLSAGDANSDGIPDLGFARGTFFELWSARGRTLDHFDNYTLPASPATAQLVDIDGDTRPDVVSATATNVDVLLDECTVH